LKDCFRDEIKGFVGRTPISERDLRYEDSVISHLMRVTIVRILAQHSGVETDGERDLWLKTSSSRRQEDGIEYALHDSVSVSLRQVAGRQYLLLKPSIKILSPDGKMAPRRTGDSIRIAVLGYQHNKEFNGAVNFWRRKLFGTTGDSQAIFGFPETSGSSFRFLIRRTRFCKHRSEERDRREYQFGSQFQTVGKAVWHRSEQASARILDQGWKTAGNRRASRARDRQQSAV